MSATGVPFRLHCYFKYTSFIFSAICSLTSMQRSPRSHSSNNRMKVENSPIFHSACFLIDRMPIFVCQQHFIVTLPISLIFILTMCMFMVLLDSILNACILAVHASWYSYQWRWAIVYWRPSLRSPWLVCLKYRVANHQHYPIRLALTITLHNKDV